jgi:hypothetical protein
VRLRRRPRPQEPTSPDHYTPPSFRGAILMLVVALTGIVLAWLAYGWALGELSGVGVPIPS